MNKTAKEVFDFLSDFNNFQKLMPEQVVDWKSTADECSPWDKASNRRCRHPDLPVDDRQPYTIRSRWESNIWHSRSS